MITKFYNWIVKNILPLILGVSLAGGTISVLPGDYNTIEEIVSAEQSYYEKNGEYLQVIKGNTLPKGERVKDKLGKDIPENVRIDVYENKLGKGYQIFYEDDVAYYSIATGSEAVHRTWIQLKDTGYVNTTSTPIL